MHSPGGRPFKMAASRKPQVSDEDYWQASSAASLRTKGFFDDSVDLAAAKKLIQQPSFGADNDDDDTVNWDGSSTKASTKVEYKSARFRPAGGSAAPGVHSVRGGSAATNAGTKFSGPSFSSDPSDSIDDVVGAAALQRPATHSQIAKLEAEVAGLKRQLQVSKNDRWSQFPPRETIKRIMSGQPYSLEIYKSKEDKLVLLDEAIKLHDGNAIIAVVLYLQTSIKTSTFNMQLMLRPIAIEHYINFLRLHDEITKLLDIYGMLGRTEDAAILKYKQATVGKEGEAQVKALQTCYRTHFQGDTNLSEEAGHIQEQIVLLERQLPVEEADSKEEKKGATEFWENPRKESLVGAPVIKTLYYCSFYHYTLSENSLASPLAVRKTHVLTDKQYVWTVLAARAKLRRWPDIEALFHSKTWLGGNKMKAPMGFDRVVHLLSRIGCPREILNKYCNFVDDPQMRLEVGQKYQCHESVIQTLSQLKDRQQLLAYRGKLKPNSQEWFLAENVLKSNIKWKT
ncbi:ADF-H domain-containing protein [Lamellibrachia satsuma]|nr:ADF-H domain-containing protein [Lamellibrachia satsuma]